MKLLKLLAAVGLLSSSAHAVTIQVAAGTPAQGFTLTNDSVVVSNFFYSVGLWNSGTSTFSVFGAPVADTGEIGGTSVTATGPSDFNSQQIHLFIGTGADIASSGSSWVILDSTSATAVFPSDVSVPGSATFGATTSAVVTVLASGKPVTFTANGSAGQFLNFVPEPSAALLGLLGAVGLLRRRRN